MCGVFYVDDETAREIERTIHMVDEQLKKKRRTGDIVTSCHIQHVYGWRKLPKYAELLLGTVIKRDTLEYGVNK